MRKIGFIVLLVLLSQGVIYTTEGAEQDSICIYVFYSEDCEHCQIINKEFLPPILEKYGSKLKVEYFEVSDVKNYDLMLKFEKKHGITGEEFPEIIIGDYLLDGEGKIRAKLEKIIEEYLAKGVDCPSLAEEEMGEAKEENLIYMAFFTMPGCSQCDRTEVMISHLERKYSALKVAKFVSTDKEHRKLFEAMCRLYDIPEEAGVPAIFIGEDHLLGGEVRDEMLDSLIQKYLPTGAPPRWEEAERLEEQAQENILERFKSFGPLTIVVAGLIDGVNPCAFATIIFFITYLTFLGRKGKEILLVGVSFTIAVFITYLLIGLGVLKFFQSLPFFPLIRNIIYGIIAVIALGLGIFSLYDYYKFKKHRIEEMTLQLPRFIKKRIHKTVNSTMKEEARMRNHIVAAFVAGFFISILESVCTGQIYLPTILFVLGVPKLKTYAFLYLILYNLMFILPLVIIFVLAFWGTSSQQFSEVLRRHIGKVKLATATLFFALAAFLISTIG